MPSDDATPGRRRALPPPRRRSERGQVRLPQLPAAAERLLALRVPRPLGVRLWLATVGVGFAAIAWSWVSLWLPVGSPRWVPLTGAVVLTTAYTFALGERTGGRPVVAGSVALVLSGTAAVSGAGVLLAGATVLTATLGAVLGVLATVPAARFLGMVREVLVATAVAGVAGFAAQAYAAEVGLQRTEYLVLGLSLVGALVLVHRLGAGFHGLGRRGFVVVLAGLAVLAVALAYTEALATWGSEELIASLEDTYAGARDAFGAVPRPLDVVLGVPALVWGVSTRARRRQGWWPCAFGAAGLAGVATSLLDTRVGLAEAGLMAAYGVVLGLGLGYLVLRGDAWFSGNRGRRARRAEAAAAHRPEPARTEPLL